MTTPTGHPNLSPLRVKDDRYPDYRTAAPLRTSRVGGGGFPHLSLLLSSPSKETLRAPRALDLDKMSPLLGWPIPARTPSLIEGSAVASAKTPAC